MPAYSKPVPKHGNSAGCSRKGIWHKKFLGVHGWAYSHSRLRGCCRPVVGYMVRTTSERGLAINQLSHQINNQVSTYEGYVLGFFVLRLAVFLKISLVLLCTVLDPRGRLGGLEGKVGSACEDQRTMVGVYGANVSDSSGAGSLGCPGQRAIKQLLCYCYNFRFDNIDMKVIICLLSWVHDGELICLL